MSRGPNGLTHRQERFCRAFAALPEASGAARSAGYAAPSAANCGYRLLKQPRIRARIAEIQAEIAAESCRATDVLLGKLEAVYQRALYNQHFHAAARAVEIQARLLAAQRRIDRAAEAAETDSEAVENMEQNAKMTRNGDSGRGRMMPFPVHPRARGAAASDPPATLSPSSRLSAARKRGYTRRP